MLLLAAGIVTGLRNFGWAAAALSVVAAVIAYVAHAAVVDFVGGVDHSLGVYVCVVGYLVLHDGRPGACACRRRRWPTPGGR